MKKIFIVVFISFLTIAGLIWSTDIGKAQNTYSWLQQLKMRLLKSELADSLNTDYGITPTTIGTLQTKTAVPDSGDALWARIQAGQIWNAVLGVNTTPNAKTVFAVKGIVGAQDTLLSLRSSNGNTVEYTDSTGNKVLSGKLILPVGSVSAPSLTFAGNTNYGFYLSGASPTIVRNGVDQISCAGTVVYVVPQLLYVGAYSTTDNSAATSTIISSTSSGAGINGAKLALSGGVPGSGGKYGNLVLQPDGGIIGAGTATPTAFVSLVRANTDTCKYLIDMKKSGVVVAYDDSSGNAYRKGTGTFGGGVAIGNYLQITKISAWSDTAGWANERFFISPAGGDTLYHYKTTHELGHIP